MKTQEEIIKMIAEFNTSSGIAKKSKFYNQIMTDGNIFNPYLHRRFLPIQFKCLINGASWGHGSTDQEKLWAYAKSNYDSDYVYNFIIAEIRKLAIMERRDRLAFEERKLFFPLEDVLSYILEYVNSLYSKIMKLPSVKYKNHDQSLTKHEKDTKFKKSIDTVVTQINEIKSCVTYTEAAKLLEQTTSISFSSFNVAVLISENEQDKFFQNFLKSGTYYYLKNIIMFSSLSKEDLEQTFNGISNQTDVCDYLFTELVSGKNWVFFYNLVNELQDEFSF